MTTHYMEEADQLCDRLAIIDQGKLLALDTPAELQSEAPGDTHHRCHLRRAMPPRRSATTLRGSITRVEGARHAAARLCQRTWPKPSPPCWRRPRRAG